MRIPESVDASISRLPHGEEGNITGQLRPGERRSLRAIAGAFNGAALERTPAALSERVAVIDLRKRITHRGGLDGSSAWRRTPGLNPLSTLAEALIVSLPELVGELEGEPVRHPRRRTGMG